MTLCMLVEPVAQEEQTSEFNYDELSADDEFNLAGTVEQEIEPLEFPEEMVEFQKQNEKLREQTMSAFRIPFGEVPKGVEELTLDNVGGCLSTTSVFAFGDEMTDRFLEELPKHLKFMPPQHPSAYESTQLRIDSMARMYGMSMVMALCCPDRGRLFRPGAQAT